MDSILNTIKTMLGIPKEDNYFDGAIIRHINSAFMTLRQIGVVSERSFKITDDTQTWHDFLGESNDLETVVTYVYGKVKMNFDPPASAFVMEAMKEQAREDEFRLNIQAEIDDIL